MAVESVPVRTRSSRDRRVRFQPVQNVADGRGRRAAGPEAGGRKRQPAGPAGPGLGNHAKTAARTGQSPEEKRAARWDARRRLGPITTLPRLAKCGKVSMIDGGEVLLRAAGAGGRAGFGGLTTCGSVWACPECSAKISARRASELDQLVIWNADRHGSIALLTLTMQHHSGHRLRALRRGLTGAWRHVTSSRGWKESTKDLGMDGYVRAIEATHGENGWHLHIHCLLIFDGPISNEMVQVLADEVWARWSVGLARQGFTAVREHAVDVRVGYQALEKLAGYINKIVFEAVGGRWKKGRAGGRTPFEILHNGLATGLADDLDLWFEWEQGSKGMRQLTWSRGLKGRVGVDDKSDEEIAAETDNGATIAVLPARTWKIVYPVAEQLLEAAEHGGRDGAYAWLDSRGLPFDPRDDGS